MLSKPLRINKEAMTTNQKAIQAKIRALKIKADATTLDKRYSIVGKINQLQREFYSLECNNNINNYLGQ
tara:strand:+ start:4898 stop:5104 length:207 start_codon:yes stop_codon:yes gene_type:complete